MTSAKPSWQHKLVVALIRPFGINRRTPEKLRASIKKRDEKWTPPKPPSRILRGVRASSSNELGWPVWTLSPEKDSERKRAVVIAVHGGGYTSEIIGPHWAFYGSLVREAGVNVVAPIYPLAPHGVASKVVPLVADLIESQVRLRGADHVGVEGDSAGAGLLLAAMQLLVQRGATVPARMVLISPWLDATVSDPRSRLIDDPLLSVEGLREAGRLWAGELDASDPLVSPINGQLKGLPATLVLSGSLDILYPDSLRLRDLAEKEGVDFAFDLREGLLHGWAGFSILPEAKAVAPTIVKRLTE